MTITKAKPADLTDACFTDGGTIKIPETQVYEGNTKCNRLYPAYSTPRMVAGEALANNVLKCQLRPITASDYGATFSAADLARLQKIFPDGVCDWSKPGVSQVPVLPWASFGPAPEPRLSNATN